MKLVEEISLPNGLVAEIWDQSREIAADTTKVTLLVRIKLTLKKEYFSNPGQLRITQRIFGPDIYYELKKERTFVSNTEVGHVFKGFPGGIQEGCPSLSLEGKISGGIRPVKISGYSEASLQIRPAHGEGELNI